MRKAPTGVRRLEVSAAVMGSPRVVCPSILWDGSSVVLVDTGFPGEGPLAALQQALEAVGVSLAGLDAVILTHQDMDHIGGLPGLVAATSGRVEVLAHAAEAPYIQGDQRLVKFALQAGAAPAPPRPAQRAFADLPKAKVTRTLAGGEELAYGGGTVVIHTPGHTPGHICLYAKQAKVLIAGDALNVEEGQLIGPRPQYTADMNAALRSLRKLADYDIEMVICYHGGEYRGRANERIAELAKEQGER